MGNIEEDFGDILGDMLKPNGNKEQQKQSETKTVTEPETKSNDVVIPDIQTKVEEKKHIDNLNMDFDLDKTVVTESQEVKSSVGTGIDKVSEKKSVDVDLGNFNPRSQQIPSQIVKEISPSSKVETAPKQIPSVQSIQNEVKTQEYDEDFSMIEDKESGRTIYTIYGLKGDGKTTFAFSFPGTKACLSFDHKSGQVKRNVYNNDENIKVYDVMMYEDYSSPEKWLSSSEKTFRYVNYILANIAKQGDERPDYVIIDGTDIFEQICEMVMRSRNNIMPYQGIANRNLWKERKLYIRQIFQASIMAAKKGVIFTTYVDKEVGAISDSEVVSQRDIPRWIDMLLTNTDDVVRVRSMISKTGQRRFIAEVESSKTGLKTGQTADVTDGGVKNLIGGDRL